MKKISESVKKQLLEYPFVTAVGHAKGRGERHKNDEHAVVAFVTEKKSESELDQSDVLPKEIEGVKVDVQPIGEVQIEPTTPEKAHDTGEVDTTTGHRPAPQGVSIGHPAITAGTAGFIAWRPQKEIGVKYPEPVGVTNNHVAANENKAEIGDNILQPGPYDGGNNTDSERAGELAGFVDIVDEDNKVDVAWYTIDGRNMNSYIPSIGVPTETVEVEKGDHVKKFGRTTGLKKGKVLSNDARVRVKYDDGVKEFEDQIIMESISTGGDSGSAVVDTQGRLAGLLFAGSPKITVANKADKVLQETGLSLNPEDVY